MKLFKMLLPYCFVYLILFYILPFMIQKNKSETIILFLVIPLLCLIVSIVFGILNGFIWGYPLIVTILYVPAVFLLADQSPAIYIVIYTIQALIGTFIGCLFQKQNRDLGKEE